MNENLMKVVERAVRPLRAGKVRKLQMREELLAHLSGIYQEERERQTDEARALTAATERFGDPAEIARELERSLGWRDRCDWLSERYAAIVDHTFGYQNGESVLRYLLRSGAWIVGLTLLLLALVMAVIWISNKGDPTFASFNRYMAVLFGYMMLGQTALLWSIQATYHALYRRRRLSLGLLNVAAWTLLFVLLGGGFWYGVTLSVDSLLERLPTIAFWTALTMPALLLLIAWATDWSIRRNETYATWAKLELDE